jgi:hypothetical protein
MTDACKKLEPGDTVFMRGGIYRPADFLDGNISKGAFVRIEGCHGEKDAPITLRPWGNEWVTIRGDGFSIVRIANSTYVKVSGLDIKGIAKNITPEEAADHWWSGEKYYNGGGIAIAASKRGPTHDITVKGCIVRDVPASGIKSYGATHVRILDNIVCNTNWWTIQGTTAVGIVLAGSLENDDPNETYNEISGNLLFGTEQRIYSRVWEKNAAKFVIDEGEAILIQEGMRSADDANGDERTGYDGRYLVANNIIAYNGKGIAVNLADKVDVRNNTLKDNGTTVLSPFTHLRNGGIGFNRTAETAFTDNVVDVSADTIPYWISRDAENPYKRNDHIKGHLFMRRSYYDYTGMTHYDDNVTLVDDRLESTIENVGATSTQLVHKAKRYGLTPSATHYTIDHPRLVQRILDAMDPDIETVEIDESDRKYLRIRLRMPSDHPHTLRTGTPYYTLEIPKPYTEGVRLPE